MPRLLVTSDKPSYRPGETVNVEVKLTLTKRTVAITPSTLDFLQPSILTSSGSSSRPVVRYARQTTHLYLLESIRADTWERSNSALHNWDLQGWRLLGTPGGPYVFVQPMTVICTLVVFGCCAPETVAQSFRRPHLT